MRRKTKTLLNFFRLKKFALAFINKNLFIYKAGEKMFEEKKFGILRISYFYKIIAFFSNLRKYWLWFEITQNKSYH